MATEDYVPQKPRTPAAQRAWEIKRARLIAEANARAKARAKAKRAKAKTVRKGKQAKRKASRSPGGFAGGGTVETDAYGKYTIARGSGAARPQKFRKNG